MNSTAKKLKEIVKGVAPKSTFGTDPRDPYSARAELSESLLDKYLKSIGLNPSFISTNTKVAHSKSGAFMNWAKNHQHEEVQVEDIGYMATQGQGGKTKERKGDIEKSHSAYKEIKTPRGPGSHNEEVMGELIKIRKKEKELTNKDIGDFNKKVKQEETELDEVSLGDYKQKATQQTKELKPHTKGEYGDIAKRMLTRREKGLKMAAKREDVMQPKGSQTGALTPESVQEATKKLSASEKLMKALDKHKKKAKDARTGLSGLDYEDHQRKLAALMKSMKSEDVGDPKAAVNADGLNTGMDRMQTERKKEMSKSAKIIKSLYKKKGVAEGSLNESVIRSETIGPYTHELHKTPWGYQVRVHAGGKQVHSDITKPTEEKGHKSFDSNIAYTKKQLRIHEQGVTEELYDTEKEDKSIATYGKKPNLEKADKDDSKGEKKPQAAAVLSGGKTLTGTDRDTIELDPMMRNRPNQPDVTKKDDKDKNKDGKKEEKKSDK